MQDSYGNLVLNREAQNVVPNPINNVRVLWHLYNTLGNIVGISQ